MREVKPKYRARAHREYKNSNPTTQMMAIYRKHQRVFGTFLICFLLNDVSLAENKSHEPNALIAHRAAIEPEGKSIKRMNY